jgi:hypothetical protein
MMCQCSQLAKLAEVDGIAAAVELIKRASKIDVSAGRSDIVMNWASSERVKMPSHQDLQRLMAGSKPRGNRTRYQ